jgi:hypothetical protein
LVKRSNTELNPLIGDFINTIDPTPTSDSMRSRITGCTVSDTR